MIPETRTNRVGTWGPVAISAMAVILVAAASEHDVNWDRLRAMSPEARGRLLSNLRKFDLELTPEQQSAMRELDRRLAELPTEERGRYLSVLRRYHDWLNSLPENRQGELTSKPSGERMALIRKLVVERPVPTGDTPTILRVIEPGEYSAFEVASAYKIWQALDAGQRTLVERKAQERARRETMFRIGEVKKKIPREAAPADFDEERWIGLVLEHWRVTRPIVLMEEKRLEDAAKKKNDVVRREFLRRQAINLYVSRAQFRPVDPERLTRFIASLPEWVQASFHALPPDEARHRASFAYRQVFPYPQEIGAAPNPDGPGSKGQAAPRPRPAAPERMKRKPAAAGENAAPF